MSDDNQTQNTTLPSDNTQTSEITNSKPIEQTIPVTDSAPSDTSPVAPEVAQDAFTMSPNKDLNEAVIPDLDETPIELNKEPTQTEAQNEPISESSQAVEAENPVVSQARTPQTSTFEPLSSNNHMSELLEKEHQAINNKRQKRLDSIMTLFAKQTNITNDEVEKYLHVSDATATRYLSILIKEGKIKQEGKTGKGVLYTPVK